MTSLLRKLTHGLPFVLAAYAILMGAIGTGSMLLHLNIPLPGSLVYYSAVNNCLVVKPITPPSWPALAEGLLRPGDCIEEIETIPWWDEQRWSELLTQRVNSPLHEREVELYIRRGDDYSTVTVPVFRLTLQRLLETQLALVLIGFGFLALGMVVLLANRQSETNKVFAVSAFIASIIAIGQQSMLSDTAGQVYTALTLSWVFSMLGAVRFHLGMIFPIQATSSRSRWLRWLLYPFAVVSIVMHEFVMIWIHQRQPWVPQVEIAASILDCGLLIIGSTAFVWRIFRFSQANTSLAPQQGQLLLWSWIGGDVPLLGATIWYQLTLSWGAPNIPILYIFFFPIISLTGIAYAMLRYQTFAYRGKIISTLTVVFLSAVLALMYTTVLVILNLFDALQFTIIWVATLATTLIWYLNTPLRRSLRRFFQRESHHYELAYNFAQQVSGDHLDLVVKRATQFICRELHVRWAAIRLEQAGLANWLVINEGMPIPLPANTSRPLSEYWPTPHTLEIPIQVLDDGTDRATVLLGMLWLGPRITSEPLDEHDDRLLSLLTHYMAYQIKQHAHIQQLTHVPIQIEDAQDRLRSEISMELHDDLLQYLASLSLEIETLPPRIQRDPEKVAEQLTHYVDEIRRRRQNMRGIMEKLGVVHQAEQRFQITTRTEMSQRCARHGIRLEWEVIGDGWDELDVKQAHTLFKIIDLAVANACHHAEPSTISIRLQAEATELMVTIIDDGCGFEPGIQMLLSKRFGLTNMKNRAEQLGGSCDIQSAPQQGTKITVRIPRKRVIPTDSGLVVTYYRRLMDVSVEDLAKQLNRPVDEVGAYEIYGVNDPEALRQLIMLLIRHGVVADYETVHYLWKRGAAHEFPEPSDLRRLLTVQTQTAPLHLEDKPAERSKNRTSPSLLRMVLGLGIISLGFIIFSLVLFYQRNDSPVPITAGCTDGLDRLYERLNSPSRWWRDPHLDPAAIQQLGIEGLHYTSNGNSEPPHPGDIVVGSNLGLEPPIIINRIAGTWVEVVHPVHANRQQWQCRSLNLVNDPSGNYQLQDASGLTIEGWINVDNVSAVLFGQQRIERVRGTVEDVSWNQDKHTIYVYISSDLYERLGQSDISLADTLGGTVLTSDPAGILAFTTIPYSQCIARKVKELMTHDPRFMATSRVTALDYTLKYTGDRMWIRPWYGPENGGWIEVSGIRCNADGK